MKTMFAALALFGVMATPVLKLERTARAEQKLAFVDLQRALAETEDGKKATAKLKGEFEKKQKELDVRQEELKKMKAEIDKQVNILKPESLAARQQELQQKVVQLQETYVRLQGDLEKRQAEEMQRIIKKMQAVVAQIAQAESITFVFEKNSGIVYGPPSLDITNELIRKYNASPAAK